MCPINKQPITARKIYIRTNENVRNIFETEVLTCMLTCTEQKVDPNTKEPMISHGKLDCAFISISYYST